MSTALAFNIIGAVVVFTVALLVISRIARQVTLVGALVGTALGFWIVAPVSLQRHHLYPTTAGEWGLVLGFFLAVFLGWSLVLSAVASWPVAVYAWLKGGRADVSLAFSAVWTAFAVPVGYVAVGLGIELTVFSKIASVDALVRFLGTLTIVGLVGAAVYWWAIRHGRTPSARAVTSFVATASIVAVIALIARHSAPSPAERQQVPSLVRRSTDSSGAPLLFIGLDGGSWRLLRPLIDAGRLPTFARLAATMRGTVQALWPPYWSTPAWGAILTGYGIDELGVHEDLAASVEGLPLFELPLTLDLVQNPVYLIELALIRANVIEPTPVPRHALRRPPVWERLSQAGVRTAVVRFPFTYPAGEQAAVVVSNRVVTDLWDLMGVEVGRPEDLVSAQDGPDGLLSWFDEPLPVDEAELAAILPPGDRSKPADAVIDPAEVLRKVFAIGQRMFAVTEHLVRTDPDLRVVMLHVTDLDNISHAFWSYRFPEEFPENPPSAADVAAFGAVPDRYLEYLDRQLARLISAFRTPPNVVVVSDHGQQAAPATMALWKGWHSSRGVFMAAGPDIVARDDSLDVSYYDVVPTLLDVLNIEAPDDFSGRSLLQRQPGTGTRH